MLSTKTSSSFGYWFHDTILDVHYVSVGGLEALFFKSLEDCREIISFLSSSLIKLYWYLLIFISNFIMVVLLTNIIYCTIIVWNFIRINNLSVSNPYIIIFYFWKDSNISFSHTFNESAKVLSFTDSFVLLSYINNWFSRNSIYFFLDKCISHH